MDCLDDPIVQADFSLLKPADRERVETFVAARVLTLPISPGFVAAVQEALSGLERINVTSGDIKQALLAGGSPATPDELRKRFETFINDRCKGKDAGKLRFMVE